MFKVREERNHTRNSEFCDYLREHGLVCSRWLRDLSLTRRKFGYHVPSVDIDALLYNRETGDLLAIFENKRGNESLSRAEKDVMLDLANKCQTPAFVLRYWNDNGSWLIKPEPLNGYATEFLNSYAILDEMGFEDFLRDLGWERFVPKYNDLLTSVSLYFPMIEFDCFQVKSLINFRPRDAKLTPECSESPEFKLWASIGDACEVPAISVVFEPVLGWFQTCPLNDRSKEYCSSGQYFSESEFVDLLYRLHDQSMPALPKLRSFRPTTNMRRIPPNPDTYKANRRMYLEVLNQK